ncbi:hypothetical protein RhiJN_21766 [Ceratobasidium sp. AG-Ba]|nr:hypothetical protein RhiJN_21766 [Ceratobasidium sp. AG-Ba]
MSARRALNTTGSSALSLLEALAESGDVFPPLQNAARDTLRIVNLVKSFNMNSDEWRTLGAYVQDKVRSVAELMARVDILDSDTKVNLENLHQTVSEIANEIECERALPWYERMQHFRRDPDLIAAKKARVEESISLFQFKVTAATSVDVKNTLKAIRENTKAFSGIKKDISLVTQNATLERLQTVKGASWDMSQVCLENTRVDLIDTILAWIDADSEAEITKQSTGATIMLLTAVAGAGKTTIAHTVACICAERKQLASSFFFDREIEGRNKPHALFATVAADLSRVDPDIANRVTTAVEEDGRLPSAPISNQFVELVLNPCRGVSFARPVVIVVDALDEAWDDRLLGILRDQAYNLPRMFRIFVTSRMRPELNTLLSRPHANHLEIDINDMANMSDITRFIPHKLRELANDMELGDDWPGEMLTTRFIEKAGGLFQWVTTVCEYLRQYDDPAEELRSLLSSADPRTSNAEEKMDKLYATILESYNWSDNVFTESYHKVMGMAISSKTPMTVSAMSELNGKPVASDRTLQRLSPLLTSMNKASHTRQPVRVLHQSLRDFLVVRSEHTPQFARFHISEGKHGEELLVLCLNLLNRDMKADIPVTGYLSNEEEESGVPKMAEGTIPEALWYACRFWPDHLCDADGTKNIRSKLNEFVERHLVKWLEVTASYGKCCELGGVWEWIEAHKDTSGIDMNMINENYAEACMKLTMKLRYDDRREEALIVIREVVSLYRKASKATTGSPAKLASSLIQLDICLSMLGQHQEALASVQEAVELYQQLAKESPRIYSYDFATSLNNLSNRLSNLGQKQEGLTAIQQAVEMFRQLAAERPAAYNRDLALSLDNLSGRLSDMGQKQEALTTIQQAVEMYRQLAAERPAAYNPNLARSLNNLSGRLSDMGQKQEALTTIQQAVEMYRQLAAERPAAYNPNLARSLNNLSGRLSDMGQKQEALKTIQQAVEMYRQLAAERPAAYNPNLARSLNNLSGRLSDMGQKQEALTTIQQAVEMYRQLAAERPAAYNPNLALSLDNLSGRLSDMGQNQEALTAIQQAVEMYRQLTAERPAAYNPGLAGSLDNLSLCLSDMGQKQEALTAIQQAVEIYQQLAAERPAAYNPDLAGSLHNLSSCLSDTGQTQEALPAIQQAVEIYRRLAAERPAAYNPNLARSLNNLSCELSYAGQDQEAFIVIKESVEMSQRLAAERPAASNPDLALYLQTLTESLYKLSRFNDALSAIQESIRLYRLLLPDRPTYFDPKLRAALGMYFEVLSSLGHHEEAAAAKSEAAAAKSEAERL